jgi:hypothetical protein
MGPPRFRQAKTVHVTLPDNCKTWQQQPQPRTSWQQSRGVLQAQQGSQPLQPSTNATTALSHTSNCNDPQRAQQQGKLVPCVNMPPVSLNHATVDNSSRSAERGVATFCNARCKATQLNRGAPTRLCSTNKGKWAGRSQPPRGQQTLINQSRHATTLKPNLKTRKMPWHQQPGPPTGLTSHSNARPPVID